MERIDIHTFSAFPYRQKIHIPGFYFGKQNKSVAIMGSTRGDEYQQMYICANLVKQIGELEAQGKLAPEAGILIIPSASQFSMNVGRRFFPADNTDINRMFPGYNLGETTQRLADSIFTAVRDYEYGIQLSSFYLSGDFVPHVRVMDTGFQDNTEANDFQLPYVIVRKPDPIDTTTLNYNWQVFNTKAFSVYSAATRRVDPISAQTAIKAILRFLYKKGILTEDVAGPGIESKLLSEANLKRVMSEEAGLLNRVCHTGDHVSKGQVIGQIIDPYTAHSLQDLVAPCDGTLFFARHAEAVAQREYIFGIA